MLKSLGLFSKVWNWYFVLKCDCEIGKEFNFGCVDSFLQA